MARVSEAVNFIGRWPAHILCDNGPHFRLRASGASKGQRARQRGRKTFDELVRSCLDITTDASDGVEDAGKLRPSRVWL